VALNTAGITAILEAGEAAVVWLGIGDGPTAGDQTSNERQQLVWDAAAGVLTADTTPSLAFTGTAGAGATHGLFFSAAAAGTFYGSEETAGDQAFNASGQYSVTVATITGSST
jgi:hypothetical protein